MVAHIDLTPEQLAEIEREIEREMDEPHDYTEQEVRQLEAEMAEDEANVRPLIYGKRRARTDKKALALQLEVWRLYVQGLGTRAIAKELKRPVTTIQRALQSLKKFYGLPARDTYEQHVLYRCPQCRSGKLCKVGRKLRDKHTFIPTKPTNVETCADESMYPFICCVCKSAIFSEQQAIQQHRQCGIKLRSEAA